METQKKRNKSATSKICKTDKEKTKWIENRLKSGSIKKVFPIRNKHGLCVPAKPFKDGVIGMAFTDKAANIAMTLLENKDLEYLNEVFGSWQALDKIRCFLVQECNVRDSELKELTWRQILAHLRYKKTRRNSLPDINRQRTTLKSFINKHCDLSEKTDIDSKIELLLREHRKKGSKIKLPMAGEFRKGQSYLFWSDELYNNWETYRGYLPTLPPLKAATSSEMRQQPQIPR